jgi:hypothetical protein
VLALADFQLNALVNVVKDKLTLGLGAGSPSTSRKCGIIAAPPDQGDQFCE